MWLFADLSFLVGTVYKHPQDVLSDCAVSSGQSGTVAGQGVG